jgi:hypothetical protein
MRTWIVALAAAGLLLGCGDKGAPKGAAPDAGDGPTAVHLPTGWPSAEERRMTPNDMPTPFSADQIRKGCPPESRRVYRMEPKGRPLDYILYTFKEPTSEGCLAEQTPCDAQGKVKGEMRKHFVRWDDLQRLTSFPADATTADEADLKTPAGTFRCMHYVVVRKGKKGAGVDKYWFAWNLPGPWVRLEQYVNGERKFTMTLVKVEGVPAPAGAKPAK